MAKWLVKANGAESGPFATKAVARSVKSKLLPRDVLVRPSDGGAWTTIDEVPAIMKAMRARKRVRDESESSGDRDDRWEPESRPLFIAAITMTALATLARIVLLGLIAVIFFTTNAAEKVGPSLLGMVVVVLVYFWAIIGMTARKHSAYKLALVLHFLNAAGGVLTVLRGSASVLFEINVIVFALGAGIVTYMARASFRE